MSYQHKQLDDSVLNNIDEEIYEPQKWGVVLWNDDYTRFDFVIDIIMKYFACSSEEAVNFTLKVHHEGRAIIGSFSKDIAETKAYLIENEAKINEFPLKVTIEQLE